MMRALTLQQPLADLVVKGHKTVENRSWKTSHRGDLVVHASKAVNRAAWKVLRRDLGAEVVPDLDELTVGAVVGVVALTGIHGATWPQRRHTPGCDVWGQEQDHLWHWVLTDSIALPEPIAATGKLGLWNVNADLAAQVEAAVKEATR